MLKPKNSDAKSRFVPAVSQAQHLNNFYKNLSKPGVRCASDKAYTKIDLLDIIKNTRPSKKYFN